MLFDVCCVEVLCNTTLQFNRPVTGRFKFLPIKRTTPTCKPCARYKKSPQKHKPQREPWGFKIQWWPEAELSNTRGCLILENYTS